MWTPPLDTSSVPARAGHRTSLEPYEEHLYRFAGARSAVLAKVADEIEAQLDPWRGEKE